MNRLIILFSFLVFFIATEVNAENKKLSARAEANDANGDGLLQKNEAKYQVKANFNAIDCDKNSGLDGAEIRRFLSGKGCTNLVFGASAQNLKTLPSSGKLEIKLGKSNEMPVTIYIPDGSGAKPMILVVHTSGGLFKSEHDYAVALQKEGFLSIVPDFYTPYNLSPPQKKLTWTKYREDIHSDFTAIISKVKSMSKTPSMKVFAVGFSNGGYWAAALAAKGDIDAGVSYYGAYSEGGTLRGRGAMDGGSILRNASSSSAPVLMFHGTEDSFVPLRVAQYFYKHYPNIEGHFYHGVDHAYDKKMAYGGRFYNEDATQDSWTKTLEFLKKHGSQDDHAVSLPPCPEGEVWNNCFGTYSTDKWKYVGDWKEDRSHGKGTETYANGDKYVGDFDDGKRHGQGKMTYANGDVYVGKFKEGKRHGKGKLTYGDRQVYVGEFKEGKRHGRGKLTYGNGQVEEGKWENNEFLDPTTAFLDTPCNTSSNEDVLGGLSFETSHPINETDYGCALVRKADGFPVFNGTQSARFEVRPGDCSASSGWDDCPNDRSRHEINESDWGSTEGELLIFELMVYIPSKPKIRPLGRNQLYLAQINVRNRVLYTSLAFLEVSQLGELQIRTHEGFTWTPKEIYDVHDNPTDKWIKFNFEVKSTSDEDGYLKVFVNDELKVHETRQTLPDSGSGHSLKFGIYNSYKSKAMEPYGKQVVYFDAISKSVK